MVTKTVTGYGNDSTGNITELTLSQEASGIVSQYKDIIREQDNKIKLIEDNFYQIQKEKEFLQQQLNEAFSTNSQLSDQNILLKAQLTAASEIAQNSSNSQVSHMNNLENQMSSISIDYQTQISFYQSENSRLLNEIENYKMQINDYERNGQQNVIELDKLRKDQEDLLELLSDQDTKVNQYKLRLRALGQQVDASDDDDDDEDDDDGSDEFHKENNLSKV